MFGACYIAGQWGEFRVTNAATLRLHIHVWYFFVFHQENMFHQISATE